LAPETNARLAAIVEVSPVGVKSLSFEIEEASKRRRGPGRFVRGRRANELSERLGPSDRALFSFLEQISAGPPFSLPLSFLAIGPVASALHNHDRVFLKQSRFGSLAPLGRDRASLLFVQTPENLPRGVLLGGELYFAARLPTQAQVRLRYHDVARAVLPMASELPLAAIDGRLLARDLSAEKTLLADLGERRAPEAHSLALATRDDIEWIVELAPERWSLFTERSESIRRTSVKRAASGIAWFEGSGEEDDAQLAAGMIEAYLEGAAFVHVGGRFVIVPARSVVQQMPAILGMAVGCGAELSALERLAADPRDSEATRAEVSALLSRSDFRGSLRDYQQDGVGWLLRLRRAGVGALLADEMGLGKTVQTLAYLALAKPRSGAHLVVAPASVVPNWVAEAEKFLPALAGHVRTDARAVCADDELIVLSYASVRSAGGILAKLSFDTLILDEAQAVKNERTQTARVVRALRAHHRIVLTGTPLENSVDELWAHATFLNPSLTPVYRRLQKRIPEFAKNPLAAELSARTLSPILLRRTKDEVAAEIPPRTVEVISCVLSEKEQKAYERIRTAFSRAIQKGTAARASSIALEALLRLRQFCALPAMLPPTLNPERLGPGTKLETAWILVEDAITAGRKLLVFSQFTAVLDALADRLRSARIEFVRLDGRTRDRKQPVRRFQEEHAVRVFLIAFRAGGFGINLTASDRVILYDPWWNPAAEEQSFARAHRIGQLRPVLIQRLICSRTVEEKMVRLRERKAQLSNVALTSGKGLTLGDVQELLM
jgi:hypothetical protein